MISTNQFKNGNHIDVEGTIFKIVEFQHVKPGKGGAFVRTKLRRASDGNVIDRTFRAGEKFRPVHTEARKMQFLYADGSEAHFMDSESYEQIAVPEAWSPTRCAGRSPTTPSTCCSSTATRATCSCRRRSSSRSPRPSPGLRGDTASGGGDKPATLETGATVRVPLFVNIGDRVKVQTASGEYMARA